MKKLTKIAILSCMMALTCISTEAKKPTGAYFGARASLDMTTSTEITDLTGWGPGFSVGLAYHAPFARQFYFEPSLMFNYNTIDFEGQHGDKYSKRTYDGYIKGLGLNIPLNFGWNFFSAGPVGLSLYTGPHIFILFSNKLEATEIYKEYAPTKLKSDLSNPGMEIGWTLGVGADFFKRWHLQIDGTYSFSHMCAIEMTRSHIRRAGISVGIGYNF